MEEHRQMPAIFSAEDAKVKRVKSVIALIFLLLLVLLFIFLLVFVIVVSSLAAQNLLDSPSF